MSRILFFFCLFLILFTAKTFPGVISPRITQIESGNSFCKIEWTPLADAIGYNVYLKNENEMFQRLNQQLLPEHSSTLIDLTNGMPYRFAISAVSPSGEESPVTVTELIIPKGFGYRTISVKGGRSVSHYVLMSSPFNQELNSPKDIFSYLPLYSLNRWRIFSMDGAGYHEFESLKKIEPGKGYWFISGRDTELFFSGKTHDAGKPFYIHLQPGWNLIGSPFLFPVEWRDVLLHNPEKLPYLDLAVWEFAEGGFHLMGTLLPFHGYLIFSSSSSDLDLLIPALPAKPKLLHQTAHVNEENSISFSKGEWLMKISASDGTYTDEDNFVGHSEGNSGSYSSPKPPSWPQHLSLYFSRRDMPKVKLSSLIANDDWMTVIEGGQNRVVTLSWKIVKGNPKAFLIDLKNHRKINMARHSSYSFSRENNNATRFLIKECR